MPSWYLLEVYFTDSSRMKKRRFNLLSTEPLRNVKASLCRAFGASPRDSKLWDYYNHKKHACLEGALDVSVEAANIIPGQALLLDARVMKLRVHCHNIPARAAAYSVEAPAWASLLEVKERACAAMHIALHGFDLWQYLPATRRMTECLEARLDEPLEAIGFTDFVMQPKVITLALHCTTPGSATRKLKVPSTMTLQELKTKACAAFDQQPGSVDFWDYYGGNKFACLEGRLQKTLAEARIMDQQALLLQTKELQVKRRNVRQRTDSKKQQQSTQQQQPQQQSKEQQLVHALLEYIASQPSPSSSSSSSETSDMLNNLLSMAMRMQPAAASTAGAAAGTTDTAAAVGSSAAAAAAAAAAAPAEVEELQQLKSCVVCMDAPRSVMLLPCKHLVLCEDCSQQLQQRAGDATVNTRRRRQQLRSACPVCRVPADEHVLGVILS